MEANSQAVARFRQEVIAFCQGPLGVQDLNSASRVADLAIADTKGNIQRANLDDLEDLVKTYLFTADSKPSDQ